MATYGLNRLLGNSWLIFVDNEPDKENNVLFLSFQFHSATEKRQNNDCGENSVTIVTEKKIEDESDSSSSDNVEIEGKCLFITLRYALNI